MIEMRSRSHRVRHASAIQNARVALPRGNRYRDGGHARVRPFVWMTSRAAQGKVVSKGFGGHLAGLCHPLLGHGSALTAAATRLTWCSSAAAARPGDRSQRRCLGSGADRPAERPAPAQPADASGPRHGAPPRRQRRSCRRGPPAWRRHDRQCTGRRDRLGAGRRTGIRDRHLRVHRVLRRDGRRDDPLWPGRTLRARLAAAFGAGRAHRHRFRGNAPARRPGSARHRAAVRPARRVKPAAASSRPPWSGTPTAR